ncbi:hypothetical protein ACHAPA_006400 [Fusarium lateritium]
MWLAEFIPLTAATVCLVLRIASRRLTKAGFWWDDYFAFACYAATIVWAIVIGLWISNGFGLHVKDIKGKTSAEANSVTLHFLFAAEQIYTFIIYFAKFSLLFFYWRMFRITNIKIAVYLLAGASTCWFIARIFLTTLQCIPVEAFWDQSLRPTAVCAVDPSKYLFASLLSHIVIDVFILTLPIMQIKKLQLPWVQKFGILLMFMFGTLVCVAGVVVISIAIKLDNASDDLSWVFTPLIIWAAIEGNMLTVSTCVPMIRPACIYLTGGLNSTSSGGYSAQNYAESADRFQPKSIRLSVVAREDASSTHELAGRLESNADSYSDPDSHTLDGYQSNVAMITSPGRVKGSDGFNGDSAGGDGIMVKNETVVRVSTTKYQNK